MWGFSPHHQAILTPAMCPTVHLNSYTMYLEIVTDPTGEVRAQSRKTALHFSCQLQILIVTYASDLLVIYQRFPPTPP